MVASLLFLALAFFAVGQAGATRNGTQSGADAAALAAAQESRDGFRDIFLDRLRDPDFLRDLFDGDLSGLAGDGCAAAADFAQENGTNTQDCLPLTDGRWGFQVTVKSQDPVGDTVLPGTENEYAESTATAIVESLCSFEPADDSPPPEEGEGQEEGEEGEPGEEASPPPEEPISSGTLRCDGDDVDEIEIDPQYPDRLPDMSDLFTVRLDVD